MRRRFVIAALALMVALAPLASGLQTVAADPTNPHKSLLMDRWYQTIAGGGIPFMTLSTFTSYGCGTECTSNWTSVRIASVADWNTSATTVYFSTTTSMTESNDVRITVKTTNCTTHFGNELCMPVNALGAVFLIDANHAVCTGGDCAPVGTQGNSIWHGVVLVNDAKHTGKYATQTQRQATLTHELGHIVSLAHDGLGDGTCGSGMPVTIMDYDCMELEYTNGVTAWDECGVNHAYYDPAWGYSGC